MKVNEIFKSIQGEGRYTGTPVLFIRLSGCTRNCSWCDTKYHANEQNVGYEEIVNEIRKTKCKIIVWTGGEPLLQKKAMYDIIRLTGTNSHHLETNGDLLTEKDLAMFNYICCSPKSKSVARKVSKIMEDNMRIFYDIKVVTDLKLNKTFIPYATILMPLSTYHKEKDEQIKQEVWNYCVENNIKYCERIHIDVWGKKQGI